MHLHCETWYITIWIFRISQYLHASSSYWMDSQVAILKETFERILRSYRSHCIPVSDPVSQKKLSSYFCSVHFGVFGQRAVHVLSRTWNHRLQEYCYYTPPVLRNAPPSDRPSLTTEQPPSIMPFSVKKIHLTFCLGLLWRYGSMHLPQYYFSCKYLLI